MVMPAGMDVPAAAVMPAGGCVPAAPVVSAVVKALPDIVADEVDAVMPLKSVAPINAGTCETAGRAK